MDALLPLHHQGLARCDLLPLHGELALQQVAEVALVRLQGEAEGEGQVQHPYVGADARRVVDEPEIRHLFFQQLAAGLVIPAEVGRLEGGVGVAVEHETGTADGQQDALVAGKA